MKTKVDLGDVQAMVHHLFRRRISRHLIFHFPDGADARGFLRELAPRITMADAPPDRAPDPCWAVGISSQGLRALGVDGTLLEKFDAAYLEGPQGGALGDVPTSPSGPGNWWEQRLTTEEVHCVVHLYVDDDEAARTATRQVHDLADRHGVEKRIPREDGGVLEGRSLGGSRLHFGYRDGISHPDVRWDETAPERPGQLDFRAFLLGHSARGRDSAPHEGPAADLVRNSAYGVFRWIYQDVAAFNTFLSTQAPRAFPHLSRADAEELLAAKMLGRWRDGTPLVCSPDHPDPGLSGSNDFAYRGQDPDGHKCPFSAHIRIVNPRDQELDAVVLDVPHALRRGMPYGPELTGTRDDGVDRGLIGIFLCSDLRHQIYRMTNWMKRNDFSPVFRDRHRQDPLFGNRAEHGAHPDFTIPRPDGDITITGLPDFVRTKGTVFLLYPSRHTLAALSAAGGPPG